METKTEEPKAEHVGLERKLWAILAEKQLRRRKRIFGKQVDICRGCQEILICSGPISFQICETVEERIESGLLKGPRKIYPFNRTRKKHLPIDTACLRKYKSLINKIIEKEVGNGNKD